MVTKTYIKPTYLSTYVTVVTVVTVVKVVKVVISPKKSKCDKTQKLKILQNSKTKNVTKHKN